MFPSKKNISLAFFSLTLLSACVNDPVKVNSLTKKNTLPIESTHDVDMLYTDSALLKIHLTAPQLDEYEGNSPYTEMIHGMKVEFFNDSGTIGSYLTSNYAIRKTREQQTEAKSKVVVVNIKGEKLETDDLIWDEPKHRIHTDAFVRITTADQVIEGTGLESDETFTNYQIKNISGTFYNVLKDDSIKK